MPYDQIEKPTADPRGALDNLVTQAKMMAIRAGLIQEQILRNQVDQEFEQKATTEMDGVQIPVPSTQEWPAFNEWLKNNGDRNPYHPDQHYDLYGAYKAGLNRVDENGNISPLKSDPNTGRIISGGHFPDTFKLPMHPTFSTESKYYKKGMPAGRWEGEKYIPIDRNK